jgi:hypothetical protein
VHLAILDIANADAYAAWCSDRWCKPARLVSVAFDERDVMDAGGSRELNEVDREFVDALISSGAINFEAIGQTIAQLGSKSLYLEDYELRWCGSDLRIYKWPRPGQFELGGLIRTLQENPLQR